jgi:hypothetical protein
MLLHKKCVECVRNLVGICTWHAAFLPACPGETPQRQHFFRRSVSLKPAEDIFLTANSNKSLLLYSGILTIFGLSYNKSCKQCALSSGFLIRDLNRLGGRPNVRIVVMNVKMGWTLARMGQGISAQVLWMNLLKTERRWGGNCYSLVPCTKWDMVMWGGRYRVCPVRQDWVVCWLSERQIEWLRPLRGWALWWLYCQTGGLIVLVSYVVDSCSGCTVWKNRIELLCYMVELSVVVAFDLTWRPGSFIPR